MSEHTTQHDTPADDAITLTMAAKALSCSRRTVERLIERGTLVRVVNAHPAAVTRQSLTSAIASRRDTHTESHTPANGLPGDALMMMLDQIRQANDATVEARSELAELRLLVRQIEDRSATKATLLETLVNGTRGERRKARKAARLD